MWHIRLRECRVASAPGAGGKAHPRLGAAAGDAHDHGKVVLEVLPRARVVDVVLHKVHVAQPHAALQQRRELAAHLVVARQALRHARRGGGGVAVWGRHGRGRAERVEEAREDVCAATAGSLKGVALAEQILVQILQNTQNRPENALDVKSEEPVLCKAGGHAERCGVGHRARG